jgi:hypothetical protein
MIRAEQIPDEAEEAAWNAAGDNMKAAIAAALNAWPDAGIEEYVNTDRGIFLPLPQGAAAPLEPRDE